MVIRLTVLLDLLTDYSTRDDRSRQYEKEECVRKGKRRIMIPGTVDVWTVMYCLAPDLHSLSLLVPTQNEVRQYHDITTIPLPDYRCLFQSLFPVSNRIP
jgi:hypothetical protein